MDEDASEELRVDLARAMAEDVQRLANSQRLRDTLVAADEMVERFGDDTDPRIRASVGLARSLAAVLLMGAGQLNEAAALFDEVVRTSGDGTPELDRLAVAALATRARALARLGRTDEALGALDELERRGVDPGSIPDTVAEVLFARGLALRLAGKPDEAMASHEEVVRRFAGDPSPAARAFAARALHDTAVIAERGGDDERQLRVYDEVVRRFGDDDAPGIQAVVAASLLSRGNVLRRTGDEPGALAAYDEVVRRFGGDDDPQVRQVVEHAAAERAATPGD